VPAKPERDDHLNPNTHTLVVTINSDLSLKLNGLTEMGSVNDTAKLSMTLSNLFQQRKQNHDYKYELRDRADLPDDVRIEKTVFIKAPRALPYADVVLVLDSIKGAGASPIGLQIDDLN
jgi:biopolymer transport protein ExbD